MEKLSGSQKCRIAIVLLILINVGYAGGQEPSFDEKRSLIQPQKGILSNSSYPLKIQTYDGSDEITHPDALCFERPWKDYRFWMTATPYPGSNSAFENPSIFVSNDGVNWSVPEGASNPIAKPPANTYLSDPDIIYHPSYGLRVYDRLVDESHNRIFFVESKDGRKWTRPVESIAVPNHYLISPAIIALNSQYLMYSVKLSDDHKTTTVERRKSEDGIAWSQPEIVSVLYARDKLIWHLDAAYVPMRKEFWLLFYSYPSAALYLAVSKDGLKFETLPIPLLTGREEPGAWNSGIYWDSGLYRSTFCVNEQSELLLWYTGTKAPASWHIGFIKTDLRTIDPYIR